MTLILVIAATGCVRRSRLNSGCVWTDDAATPLVLSWPADVRHLSGDAVAAEELAIRFADRTKGLRSGHFTGSEDYAAARTQCLARLFDTIGRTHDVDAADVRQLLDRRPLALDLPVLLGFALVYGVAANALAARLVARFHDRSVLATVSATIIAACAIGAAGVLVFGVCAGAIEMVRVGNAHLSYRAGRLPWHDRSLALWAGGSAIFAAAAYRRGRTRNRR
jgi:hypothetical protein